MLPLTNAALMNMMACRVYRDTVLGVLQDSEIPTISDLRAVGSVISLSVLEAGTRTTPGIHSTVNTAQNAAVNDIDSVTFTKMVDDRPVGDQDTDKK
jgi:hypothetical protein